jgi:hypothetical protein
MLLEMGIQRILGPTRATRGKLELQIKSNLSKKRTLVVELGNVRTKNFFHEENVIRRMYKV